MSETLKYDRVEIEPGIFVRVSTIRTDAGGAPATQRLGDPFSSADYIEETPWPYETMVFSPREGERNYHEAYKSQKAALAGHARISAAVKGGSLPFGKGTRGTFGTPSLTPEQFAAGRLQGD